MPLYRRRYLRRSRPGGAAAPDAASGSPTTRTAPPAIVGAGGGVGPRRPSPKPTIPGQVAAGGFTQPPFMTYDPAIEAQRRAVQRGLEDKIQDVKTERHFNRRDLAQTLRDIRTNTQRSRGKINREVFRSREDINRESSRAQEGINEREGAERLDAQRANQDFDTQLANIGRQFTQLGQRQAEGANAAGVLGSGTQEASAAARAQNQALAEQPIAVARQRVEEDLAATLRQLGVRRGEISADAEGALRRLLEDQQRGLGQLKVDRDRERRLNRRSTGRKEFGLTREAQRARREAAITNQDLIEQQIYQARQNRPGAIGKTGPKPKKKKGR